MPAALADSALYGGLFGDEATAAHFTEAAEIAAMLRVEGALARVQGDMGLIPAEAATAIERASRSLTLEPAALAAAVAVDGVAVPGLVAAFRQAMAEPEHAAYVHWGATSQDIVDTALALRLRPTLQLWHTRIDRLLAALADLAERHADLPMAARTYGQVATPTSFGAVVAGWGRPLLRHRARLQEIEGRLMQVSLGGAAGTLSAMGAGGPSVRGRLAEVLDLHDPGASWHAERDGVAAFGAWMAGIAGSLGKLGEDLILLAQSGIGEVRIRGAGGSSTMPQKRNPIGPSVLVALARQAAAAAALLQGALVHRQARDGAAWFTEWLALPPLCITTGRTLALALDLAGRVEPDAARMAAALEADGGTIHAEAASFTLAERLSRPAAQAAVKALCGEAAASGADLRTLLARDYPDLDWPALLAFDRQLGEAPSQARAFATQARAFQPPMRA